MRKKEEKSAHHTLLGGMMMFGTQYQTSSGANFWRYEFRQSAVHGQRPYKAVARIKAYLEEKGYILKETREERWGPNSKSVTYIYLMDDESDDEVRVVESHFNGDIKVNRVSHFPNGRFGPYRGTLHVSDVIRAMSWGMA